MKREIKFRAWCDKGNQMHTPCEVYAGENGELYTRTGYSTDTGYLYNIHTNIQQFTGLLEKNGKEVYEGDVVYAAMIHHGKPGLKFKAKIVYNAHVGCYQISYLNINERFVRDNIGFSYQLEIIGNIYENPELLRSAIGIKAVSSDQREEIQADSPAIAQINHP